MPAVDEIRNKYLRPAACNQKETLYTVGSAIPMFSFVSTLVILEVGICLGIAAFIAEIAWKPCHTILSRF